MRSPLLRSVEARVANLTGIAPHPHASGADLLLQARWPHDYDTNNPLHHDMNRAPRRVATVIMYLSGSDEMSGGHTLFPCLRPRSDVAITAVMWMGHGMGASGCAELAHGFEVQRKRELPARKERLTDGVDGSVSRVRAGETERA